MPRAGRDNIVASAGDTVQTLSQYLYCSATCAESMSNRNGVPLRRCRLINSSRCSTVHSMPATSSNHR